jgi:2-methylcitrate dehydratase PrpD
MRQPDLCESGSLLDGVAMNCALARLSEVDDIHLASMTTAGAIVIPGALTIARSLPHVEPADLVAATLGGYEAMIRLGSALDGPAILYRGIWPTYFSAPFGIAAVAARLMRLGEHETAQALALALTLASPGVGHRNAPSTSRWLAVGNAARNGLTAALAAQSGFTSDLEMLESGFFAGVYDIEPNAAALTNDLGSAWMLAQVSFKPWCAARQTMAATQALREIVNEGVAADDIREIQAAVLPPHVKMIDHGVTSGDRASFLTSAQYQMAIAALAPVTAFNLGAPASGVPAPVLSLMQRIKIVGDDSLLASYPAAWPARVSVVTRTRSHERVVTQVPGDPARPLGVKDLADKFYRLVTPAIGSDWAKALHERATGWSEPGRSKALMEEIDRICLVGTGDGAAS